MRAGARQAGDPGRCPALLAPPNFLEPYPLPRFLVSDCPEVWRRIEHTALRREEVEIVLARGAEELARRARAERFDAVLVVDDSERAAALECVRALPGAGGELRLVACAGAPDEAEIAARLGLDCRRIVRRPLNLVVQAEGEEGLTRDATPEGLFVIGLSERPQGARLQAALRAFGRRRRARANLEVVRVVRAAEDSHRLSGLGVRLRPSTSEDAALIEEWLQAQTARAAGSEQSQG